MRRPLLFVSFCLILFVAVRHYRPADAPGGRLPDGTGVALVGQVCQKDDNSFVVKLKEITIQDDSSNQYGSGRFSSNQLISDSESDSKQNPNQIYSNQNSYSQEESKRKASPQNGREQPASGDRLLCKYESAEELALDSEIILEGKFYAFTGASNPGEFDYAEYYHSLGYVGRLKEVRVTAQSRQLPGVREALYRLRCFWEARLYQVFPQKEASIMTAILLGDKSEVDGDVKELYRRNGIIHILSISGLHITLIGMGLYKILRRLGAPAWLAALGGGGILSMYGIMTGLGVSVCRAMGMYLLRMLAVLLGRTYDMLTALGVMAAGMICLHPAWLGNMGFLLSFGSVLGVGGLLPALSCQGEDIPRLRRYAESRWRRWLEKVWEGLREGLRQSFLAGLSITLTTLPLQLWFSYEVPTYSILLNIVILPFMGIVLAAGLAAMLIPGLGIAGTADVVILAGYEGICRLAERLPYPVWNPGRPQIWQIAVYYLLWAAVLWSAEAAGRGRGVKPRRKAAAACSRTGTAAVCSRAEDAATWLSGKKRIILRLAQFVMLGAAVLVIGRSDIGGDSVTFLDVGQGDCICVRLSSGEVYIFDCGSGRSHIGERVLIPFLKYHGIHSVDAVFVSHADADHVSGILELLEMGGEEHIEVGQLVLPGIDRALWQEEFGELLAAAGGLGGQGGGRAAADGQGIDGAAADGRGMDEAAADGQGMDGAVADGRGMEEAGGDGQGMDEAGDSVRNIPVTVIRAGECWMSGNVREEVPQSVPEGGISAGESGDSRDYFLCLHPAGNGGGAGGNEGSECFYIELHEGEKRVSLLLTGDVEGAGERQLLEELRRCNIQDVTVLKVAHHGSRNSTSGELLARTKPEVAVISCGKNNRYGHPHAELLERLEEAGSRIYTTAESGAVRLWMDGSGAGLEEFRNGFSR